MSSKRRKKKKKRNNAAQPAQDQPTKSIESESPKDDEAAKLKAKAEVKSPDNGTDGHTRSIVTQLTADRLISSLITIISADLLYVFLLLMAFLYDKQSQVNGALRDFGKFEFIPNELLIYDNSGTAHSFFTGNLITFIKASLAAVLLVEVIVATGIEANLANGTPLGTNGQLRGGIFIHLFLISELVDGLYLAGFENGRLVLHANLRLELILGGKVKMLVQLEIDAYDRRNAYARLVAQQVHTVGILGEAVHGTTLLHG